MAYPDYIKHLVSHLFHLRILVVDGVQQLHEDLLMFQDELNADLVVEELVEAEKVLDDEFIVFGLLDVELRDGLQHSVL